MELGKVKYKDDLNDIKETLYPYNPKFDQLPQSLGSSNAGTADSVQNEGPPAKVYGPSSTSCPCCEMEVRHGTKFLFLRCCKSLYHQKCIEVWLMCQKFCPNKKCGEVIKISQYFL